MRVCNCVETIYGTFSLRVCNRVKTGNRLMLLGPLVVGQALLCHETSVSIESCLLWTLLGD